MRWFWRLVLTTLLPAPRSQVVSFGPDPKARGELLITLQFTPHPWVAALGEESFRVTYSGSGTVWRNIETGERANTWMESRLANECWKRERELGT